MPELGTYGSVRGALSNGRLYRDGTTTVVRNSALSFLGNGVWVRSWAE